MNRKTIVDCISALATTVCIADTGVKQSEKQVGSFLLMQRYKNLQTSVWYMLGNFNDDLL